MKETNLVNLHFTEAEVLEALELWCQNNHTALTAHFRRRASFDWNFNEKTYAGELVVMFDGEVTLDKSV